MDNGTRPTTKVLHTRLPGTTVVMYFEPLITNETTQQLLIAKGTHQHDLGGTEHDPRDVRHGLGLLFKHPCRQLMVMVLIASTEDLFRKYDYSSSCFPTLTLVAAVVQSLKHSKSLEYTEAKAGMRWSIVPCILLVKIEERAPLSKFSAPAVLSVIIAAVMILSK